MFFQAFESEVIRLGDEYNAEKVLEEAVKNLDDSLSSFKNSIERVEPSVDSLEKFKNTVLQKLTDGMQGISDQSLPFMTPRMKELHENAESLQQRFNEFVGELNAKILNAKDQDNLLNEIEKTLADMRQSFDEYDMKYQTPIDLPIAMDDIKQLQLYADQLNALPVDGIKDRQKLNKIAKERDNLRSRLEVGFILFNLYMFVF